MLGGASSPTEDRAAVRRFSEVDWDFTAQASESPFSAVHWHPCRFPSQIPAITIGRFTSAGETVLDPFMGSATTLVEAQRLGRRSIGIDINPVSCLLGKAKTIADEIGTIIGDINALRLDLATNWETITPSEVPSTVQSEKWYMPSTLTELRKIWTVVKDRGGPSGVIGRACFSSILLAVCKEDRHWGYVCDNTTPKSNREPSAAVHFANSITKVMAAYSCNRNELGGDIAVSRIINSDAAEAMTTLDENSIDCIVTSPPYFGVADYVKAQRLTMEWLEAEIEPVRRKEIGARSKRHRNLALESYLSELRSVFVQARRVMKPNAIAVVVFGQSPSRPDAQTGFMKDLREIGFAIEMERSRHISVGRRQMPSLARETVIVVRK